MPTLHARLVAPLLVFSVLSSFGCDDNGSPTLLFNGGSGPSPHSSAPFVSRGAMVEPATILAQRARDAICPTHPPFFAPFDVVFHGDGRSDLFLSNVQMQFVDSAGIPAGAMTLGRFDLTTRFGSTTLPAFGTRVFPFSFPFGCVGVPGGTLTVIVLAGDSGGRESRTVRRLAIR